MSTGRLAGAARAGRSVAEMRRSVYGPEHLDFGEAFRGFMEREVLPNFEE